MRPPYTGPFISMLCKPTKALRGLFGVRYTRSNSEESMGHLLQSRPVYIELPTNMVKVQVPASPLDTPIDLSIPMNDEGFEDTEVDVILNKMYASKQPFIVVDGCTSRYGVSDEADELVRETGFPTSTTPFGKGIVQNHPEHEI